MIVLLGIKKHTSICIRESLTIKNMDYNNVIEELLLEFDECAILNTCNRVEIYIKCNNKLSKKFILNKIFTCLKWDPTLVCNMFMTYDECVYKHLFELACGFHSKIIGEEQILGQIRESYKRCKKIGALKNELLHLFESAIACGKEFVTESKLYKIPVSSASIVANRCLKMKFKKLMIIGFGDVGQLVVQYLKNKCSGQIFVVVRDKEKYKSLKYEGVVLLDYKQKNDVINNMDIIISCTSSPHTIIREGDIRSYGNEMYIFDLALPRDVDERVAKTSRVKLFNIDEISKEDDINKKSRLSIMGENKYIIKKHIDIFISWKSSRELSDILCAIKDKENKVCNERVSTYLNKTSGEDEEIVKTLIKSASSYYVNKAIEVLKGEMLEGEGEKCLRIIRDIFLRGD